MLNIKHILFDFFIEKGLSEETASFLNMIGLLLGVIIVVFAIDYVTKRFLWRFSSAVAKRTKTNFDNIED